MSSHLHRSFRQVFSDETDDASAAAAFHIPIEAIVRALRQASKFGADHLYETMLKTALMVEMRAQTYGLAIFQQEAAGDAPVLKWAEGLDDDEMEMAAATVAEALAQPENPPQLSPGDQSLCLLLAYPYAQQSGGAGRPGAAIYGRCVRPLSVAQVGEISTITEVAHLAHEHAALNDELQSAHAAAPTNGAPETREATATTTARPKLTVVEEQAANINLPGVIYESRALAQLAHAVDRIKNSTSTVLITGESGTGKELVAHAIHRLSQRARSPFIPFNCTAAPGELIESILFGHRRGSFTGAHADHEGLIRAAEGGTLFLDEIGDLPLTLQPKLLRFLQDGEVHPLGEREPRRVNVRVVAATHKNLERAAKEGSFREDLYYRLAALTLAVPPLRERPEDTAALISHFLTYYTRRNDRDVRGISWEAVNALQNYSWPGNVRELAAEIERLVLYADEGTYIGLDALNARIWPANGQRATEPQRKSKATRLPLDEMLGEMERRIIIETLKRYDYNVAGAAAALGLSSRQTLYKKIKRLAIKINEANDEQSCS